MDTTASLTPPIKEPSAAPPPDAPLPPAALSSFVDLSWDSERPVSIDAVCGSALVGRAGVPAVEVFTAREQRARTSQGYTHSAVGSRLRYVSHRASSVPGAEILRVTQHDEDTGLRVTTTFTHPDGVDAVRIESAVENRSDAPVVLTAVAASVGIGASQRALDRLSIALADSEWLAENRWQERPLRDLLPELDLPLHGQDGRGHASASSHGSWSTGEHLPTGVIAEAGGAGAVHTSQDGGGPADAAATNGAAPATTWQIETSAGWTWDISQALDGAILSLLGPTDREHQFAVSLNPGARFDAVPVALAVSPRGRDGAIGQMTRYRRWLRGESRSMRGPGSQSRPKPEHDAARPKGSSDPGSSSSAPADPLPVVYNDFMNTLMGQPSTDALLPLIDAAADAGADAFCIDAGWFAEPSLGDWWSTVGEWREAPSRFDGGLHRVIEAIHARGMRSGLWLEPEVVGIEGPAADALPDEAFFVRYGQRVVEDRRYHLDFRHPAARAHMDATVDHLVESYGISFLKLDYNINPGVGTDRGVAGAGHGLLEHTRAYAEWLAGVQRRHPGLAVENCASGAMRADYSLLALADLQSTSDQQDFRLYPPIAASAPASIAPEQCGNWAYPDRTMSLEETAFTLVTGLAGRLYLSGFLHRLRPEQSRLVAEAVAVYKTLRADLPDAIPFWPLGLPAWDDAVVMLGWHARGHDLLFVWDRSEGAGHLDIPVAGAVETVFPARAALPAEADLPDGADAWTYSRHGDVIRIETAPGHTARVLRLVA